MGTQCCTLCHSSTLPAIDVLLVHVISVQKQATGTVQKQQVLLKCFGLADLLLCGSHLGGLQHLLHIIVQLPASSIHDAPAASLQPGKRHVDHKCRRQNDSSAVPEGLCSVRHQQCNSQHGDQQHSFDRRAADLSLEAALRPPKDNLTLLFCCEVSRVPFALAPAASSCCKAPGSVWLGWSPDLPLMTFLLC